MSRLDILTVVIVAVCLAALGYLVYKIVILMNPPEEENPTAIQDAYNLGDPESDDTYTWEDETDAAQDSLTYQPDPADEQASTTATEYGNSASDDEYDDAPAREEPRGTGNTATAPAETTTRSTPSSAANGGRYLVIAGNYRQRVNAENQVERLKRMGYNEAEVELFDRGSFAVVIVDRFSSLAQADQLSTELKGKGIPAYVKDNG